MAGNDAVNGIDRLGLIDYKFDKAKCILDVTLKWELTFNRGPERKSLFERECWGIRPWRAISITS